MPGIFSRLGLIALLAVLTACGERAPEIITPPKEVAATVEPFLTALRNGEKQAAAAYVFESAADELDAQFGADHVKLAEGPVLKPRLMRVHPAPVFGADLGTVTIVYAARQKGRWTSATVRLQRVSAQWPYKVEYWRVNNNPPSLATGKAASEETAAMTKNARLIFWGIVALLASLVLALVVWAYRNRTRPVVDSDDDDERRPVASTTRD
jgi:predicted small lipoprotein YifL